MVVTKYERWAKVEGGSCWTSRSRNCASLYMYLVCQAAKVDSVERSGRLSDEVEEGRCRM